MDRQGRLPSATLLVFSVLLLTTLGQAVESPSSIDSHLSFGEAGRQGRRLSAVACRDLQSEGNPNLIRVDDAIWKEADFSLQRLISCLPASSGGVLEFNTTAVLIPEAAVFVEDRPVVITTAAAQEARIQGQFQKALLDEERVTFGCPEGVDDFRFMEISNNRVVLDHVAVIGCKPPKEFAVMKVDETAELVLRNTVFADTVRDSEDLTPVILADSGSTLKIENSTFSGNKVGSPVVVKKGAIVEIESARFESNSVVGNGGAVDVEEGGRLVVVGGKFIENRAECGGAVHSIDGDVELSGCEFLSNQGTDGGAVCFEVSKKGKAELKVADSEFRSNSADVSGGALSLNGTMDVIMNGTKFDGNNAQSGGAVHVNGEGTIEIEKAEFVANSAAVEGGAVKVVSVENATFSLALIASTISGSSAKDGGGLHAEGPLQLELKNDVDILENSAENQGGGLWMEAGASLTGEDIRFARNQAEDGGAIYFQSEGEGVDSSEKEAVTLKKAKFSSNSAEGYGGGLYIGGAPWKCDLGKGVEFSKNKASKSGGGISLLEGAELNIDGANFNENEAVNSGGAISAQGFNLDGRLIISGSKFVKNKGESGGAVTLEGGKSIGQFSDVDFERNSVSDMGGGVFVLEGPNLEINGSRFEGNDATTMGGGITIQALTSPTEVMISGSIFDGNSAGRGGGMSVIAPEGTGEIVKLTLKDEMIFSSNEGFEYGGAISITDQADVKISDSTFKSNNAGISGGGIAAKTKESMELSIGDSEFAENNASSGGALELSGPVNCELVTKVRFLENKANQGGAVFMSGKESSLSGTKPLFRQNLAANGGGISALGPSFITLSGAIFEFNEAKSPDRSSSEIDFSGGAVSTSGTVEMDLKKSTFSRNSAQTDGGAVVVATPQGKNAPKVVLEDVDFKENSAGQLGGALTVSGKGSSELTVKDTSFSKNSAKSGGAVWVKGGSAVVGFSTTIFKSNSAEFEGGSLGAKDVQLLEIEGGMASENTAGTLGGALSVECSTEKLDCSVTIASVIFLSNTAGERITGQEPCTEFSIPDEGTTAGGAVDFRGNGISVTILKDTIFENNSAFEGGAIRALGASRLNISSAEIVGNDAVFGGAVAVRDLETSGSILLRKTDFLDNEACLGGAIYSMNGKVNADGGLPIKLMDLVLENNVAKAAGGALFANSTENIGICCGCGGAEDPELQPLDDMALAFIDLECATWWDRNRVVGGGHGDVLASPIVDRVVNPRGIQGHISGTFLPVVNVSNVDAFGQWVPAQGVFVKVGSEGGVIRGQTTADMFSGVATFEGTLLQAPPGEYELTYRFTGVSTKEEVLEPVSISVQIRSCNFGEFAGLDGVTCEKCPEGKYNFGQTIQECRRCPENAYCNGTLIVPLDGYWHSSIFSTQIHECVRKQSCEWGTRLKDLEEASAALFVENSGPSRRRNLLQQGRVGVELEDFQCKEGYEGPICGSCNATYARIKSDECMKCKEKSLHVFSSALLAIWYFVLAAFLIRYGWKLGLPLSYEMSEGDVESEHGMDPHPEPVGSSGMAVTGGKRMSTEKPNADKGGLEMTPIAKKLLSTPSIGPIEPHPGPSVRPGASEIETDVGGPSGQAEGSTPPSVVDSEDIKQIKIDMNGDGGKAGEGKNLGKKAQMTKVMSRGIVGDETYVEPDEDDCRLTRKDHRFEVVKIILNFMQVTSLAGFIGTNWIEAATKAFEIQDVIGIGGDVAMPIGCTVDQDDSDRSVVKMMIALGFPVALAVFFIFLWMLLTCCSHRSLSNLWNRWVLSVWVVLYIAYSHITRRSLKSLYCVDVDEAETNFPGSSWALDTYWSEDTSVKCFEGDHDRLVKVLAVPLLVVVTVGIPFLLLMILFFNRRRLQEPSLLRKYGFLYQSYRFGWHNWEFMIFLRKALVAAVVVFGYRLKPELQSVLAMAVLMIALFLQLWVWPFRQDCIKLNRMEAMSLFITILAFYDVMLIENRNVGATAGEIVAWVLVVFTVLASLYMLVEFIREWFIGVEWELLKHGVRPGHGRSPVRKVILLQRLRLNAATNKSRSGLRNLFSCFRGFGF
ncbi:hypothetical protein BSKO_09668 [Bryopsis sp. KO-2023]|nr:hypothetical protein BSKO_09668 [Bryopsis sp. KO-2023]